MKILVLNGPNINMLGIREPGIYGKNTFADLLALLEETGSQLGIEISQFQSNHEGDLVDKIQWAYGKMDGIVINPAAYTHTSVAILDALKAVSISRCGGSHFRCGFQGGLPADFLSGSGL